MTWHLRPYLREDAERCGLCYLDAIRNGTRGHYTAAQAAAWAQSPDPSEWAGRLSTGTTWVAEDADLVAGFLTLTGDGHLDLFFVRPSYRKSGAAAALYQACIDHAHAHGMQRLTTHASLLAKSFLARRGWTCLEEEQALRNGQYLTRFRMTLEKVSP